MYIFINRSKVILIKLTSLSLSIKAECIAELIPGEIRHAIGIIQILDIGKQILQQRLIFVLHFHSRFFLQICMLKVTMKMSFYDCPKIPNEGTQLHMQRDTLMKYCWTLKWSFLYGGQLGSFKCIY